jgi:HlyB family type I secretion system ABC transporter
MIISHDKILTALKENLVFSMFAKTELDRVAPYFSPETHKLGEVVVSQGQPSDGFYLILSGKARVVNAQKDNLTLAVLKKGDGFGEQSLLTQKPAGASVRASGKLVLLKMGAGDFLQMVSDYPQVERYFQEVGDRQSQFNSLKTLKIFSELRPPEIETLIEGIETVTLNTGDFLFREGDAGDAAYIVQGGRIQILTEETKKILSIAREGSLIGEISLIRDQPRLASAKALEACRLYRLTRKLFQNTLPRIKDTVEQIITNRILQYETFVTEKQGKEIVYPKFQASVAKIPLGFRPRAVTCVTVNDEMLSGLGCVAMILHAHNLFPPPRWHRWATACLQKNQAAGIYDIGQRLEQAGLLVRKVKIKPEALQQVSLPALFMDEENRPMVLFGFNAKEIFIGDPSKGLRQLPRADFLKFWNGELLLSSVVPEFGEVKTSFWSIYARFLPLIRPHKGILAWIFAASAILTLLGLAAPFFSQTIIDKVLVFSDKSLLKLMLVGMLCVTTFQLLGSGLRSLLTVTIMQRLEAVINTRLFQHVLSLPMYRFNKFRVGEYSTRFEENKKLLGMISETGMTLVMDITTGAFYLLQLFAQNAALTGLGVLFIIPQALIVILSSKKLRKNDADVFEASSDNMSFIIDMIGGMQTVKSLAGENDFYTEGMDKLSRERAAEWKGAKFANIIEVLSEAFSSLGTLALLAYGSYMVMGNKLTIGQFVAFNAVYGLLMGPIERLVGLWDEIQEMRISYARVNDILELPVEKSGQNHELLDVKGRLRIEDLDFRYPGLEKDTLSKIDLEIQPGQKVALIGRSGCGKSTLINLVCGFLQPDSGKIYIDNTHIESLDRASLLTNIGVVEQKPFLFSGTIRDNIALTDPDLPYEKIVSAAALSGVKEFTDRMPLGLETRVGEGGMSLSGGQVQRIAIARAIVRGPAILILDEATSALDTESERIIQKNLDKLMKNRTTLVIAHRLSTIMNSDLIVVLDEGRIVEAGTHDSLVEKKGLYHYLLTSGQQAA